MTLVGGHITAAHDIGFHCIDSVRGLRVVISFMLHAWCTSAMRYCTTGHWAVVNIIEATNNEEGKARLCRCGRHWVRLCLPRRGSTLVTWWVDSDNHSGVGSNPSIALASHLCTCVLHRQLCYLHTLKLPKFFNFHGDFHQKWLFAHPEFSFAHPELPFLAKSMNPSEGSCDIWCQKSLHRLRTDCTVLFLVGISEWTPIAGQGWPKSWANADHDRESRRTTIEGQGRPSTVSGVRVKAGIGRGSRQATVRGQGKLQLVVKVDRDHSEI